LFSRLLSNRAIQVNCFRSAFIALVRPASLPLSYMSMQLTQILLVPTQSIMFISSNKIDRDTERRKRNIPYFLLYGYKLIFPDLISLLGEI